MPVIALVFAAFASTAAVAAPAPPIQPATDERREPTAQEIASFDAFRAAHAPDAKGTPVFHISRLPGQRDWNIEVTVDGAASRGVAPLCRMTRSVYEFNARAPRDRRWSAAAPQRFAWLDRAGCGKPTRDIELLQRIPDTELIPLIDQHGVLLLRARLLFSGNTSCAPHRSLRFRISAIDVSAPPHGREELHGLVFHSDRAARATVWVKKTARELTAWDVACLEAPASP